MKIKKAGWWCCCVLHRTNQNRAKGRVMKLIFDYDRNQLKNESPRSIRGVGNREHLALEIGSH